MSDKTLPQYRCKVCWFVFCHSLKLIDSLSLMLILSSLGVFLSLHICSNHLQVIFLKQSRHYGWMIGLFTLCDCNFVTVRPTNLCMLLYKVIDTGGQLRDKVNRSFCPSLFVFSCLWTNYIRLQVVAETTETVFFSELIINRWQYT